MKYFLTNQCLFIINQLFSCKIFTKKISLNYFLVELKNDKKNVKKARIVYQQKKCHAMSRKIIYIAKISNIYNSNKIQVK